MDDNIKRFVRYGKRYAIRKTAAFIVWYILILVCWLFYVMKFSQPILNRNSFVFILLILLPAVLLDFHKCFTEKTYYGVVERTDFTHKTKQMIGYQTIKQVHESEKEGVSLYIKCDDGKQEYLELFSQDICRHDGYYQKGDRILKIKLLKYPVKCCEHFQLYTICPKCGSFMDVSVSKCRNCFTRFH